MNLTGYRKRDNIITLFVEGSTHGKTEGTTHEQTDELFRVNSFPRHLRPRHLLFTRRKGSE